MDIETIQSRLDSVVNISILASKLILDYYNSEKIQVIQKQDSSPLTTADQESDALIRSELARLTPGVPVLSEEVDFPPLEIRAKWDHYWLVDPLDGTKEFLEKTDEFTVNIALVSHNKPVFGIIASPVEGEVFLGNVIDKLAYKYDFSGTLICKLVDNVAPINPLRFIVSRRHSNSNKVMEFIESFSKASKVISCGSSLKFCRLAENRADIYPRFGQTGEWDTAAGHALLKSIGGNVYQASNGVISEELSYNTKESSINPEFVALRSQHFL